MSTVSVIIPNYNHAEYLEQRIESILDQTFQNFEIIILDDYSTDTSRDIIEQYRHHPKVSHIIYNSKNSGSSFIQWIKGIEVANGEWIWIAESDDWCETSLLKELMNGVIQYPTCTISYCQSIMFQDNEILWQSSEKLLNTLIEGRKFVETKMLKGNAIFNASMCLFKKQSYFNISLEFTKYKFCGDWLFWIEIAKQGDVFISGKTLNYFRKHKNDISTKAFSQGLVYREYFKLIDYLKETAQLEKEKSDYLILEKLKQFLIDKKVTDSDKKLILKIFKTQTGFKYYHSLLWQNLFRLKNQLKKYKAKRIKNYTI